MSLDGIEQDFPNLKAGEWIKSSEYDEDYNCIAFAVHDTRQFWDPDYIGVRGYYWPPGIDRDFKVSTLTRLFEIHGFKVCDNGDSEIGYEKIAIYAHSPDDGTHAARQRASGIWTSKLGVHEDIEHTAAGLEEGEYGNVAVFMKRPRIRGVVYE